MLSHLLSALPLLLATSTNGLALVPTDDAGVEPYRLRRTHALAQKRNRDGASWQQFLAEEGAGWQARFDEQTGTPHRAWGPGIPLVALADADDEQAIQDALTQFMWKYADLLGVPGAHLKATRSWGDDGRLGFRFVQIVPAANTDLDANGDWGGELDDLEGSVMDTSLDLALSDMGEQAALDELRHEEGVSVWRSGVDARVVDGKLVMLRVTTVPSAAELSLSPGLSAETAIEIAVSEGPRPDVHHDVEGAVLVVLPSINRVHVEPTLCWVVRTRTAGPDAPGLWVTFVDAETGEVHNVHNQVRFASGTMWATHDTRTVNGDFSTSIVPNARISNGDSSSRTDDNGEWELSGSSFEGVLNGSYFNVKNDDGSEGSLAWSGSDDPTWTDDEATQGEIDSYIFLSQVHDWAEVYASQLDIVDEKMTSNVNLDETCNAYYDGTVNFYQQGNGCNNTARIGDVNYHEWGHGMHYSATGTWWLDGSVGEGVGDIVAFLQTGDSTIAPYFMMNGSGIRDVSDDRVYPDDVVGEVHEDGLIFGGAVWDLWEELEDELDADEAYDVLSTIFVEAIEANPDIPGTYDEFMAADDDNGDLSDGTPNQCAIIDAFSRHGLGPGSSGSVVELAMEAIDNQDPEETVSKGLSGYAVEAEMINLAPECSDAEVLAASVVFSTDGGGNWDTADLGTDGELIWGELPAQDDGSIVHYYIEVETASEGVVTLPRGATINPLSFFVGQLEEIRCDDFEDDDAGYDHDLIGGDEQEGADDWIWGTPLGYADDPDVAASGNMVWGNDLGGGNYNGEYQDGKHNRLTTPSVDVAGYERVILQFNRWLNVEDGYYDQARVLQGEDTIWTNHESNQSIGDEHHADEQWSPHTVELEVDSGEAVTVSWEIESDGGLSFGGWNIDDVCFYGVIPVETTDDIDDETSPELGSGVSSTDSTALDADFAVCGCSAPAQAAGPRAVFAWAIGLAGLVLRRRRQKQDMSS